MKKHSHDGLHRELTEKIIGAGIEVHREMGPGLLESSYEECLTWALTRRKLELRRQVELPVVFEGHRVNAAYRIDKVAWIRKLFDLACAEYDRLDLDRDDPVAAISAEFEKGLEGVTEKQVRAQLVRIERVLSQWAKGRKFYGHMFDDVLKLKYLHQRYTNYLKWLLWKG